MQLTLNRLGVLLEELKRARDDTVEALLNRRGNVGGVHLHERAERHDAELLVVHTWQAILAINCLEPLVEERTSGTRRIGLHDMESGTRVVEYRVHEHLQVRQAESSRVRSVLGLERGGNNSLERLKVWLL